MMYTMSILSELSLLILILWPTKGFAVPVK